jgi:hypothetical protein
MALIGHGEVWSTYCLRCCNTVSLSNKSTSKLSLNSTSTPHVLQFLDSVARGHVWQSDPLWGSQESFVAVRPVPCTSFIWTFQVYNVAILTRPVLWLSPKLPVIQSNCVDLNYMHLSSLLRLFEKSFAPKFRETTPETHAESHGGLQIKCLSFSYDFKRNWKIVARFNETSQCDIS